MEGERESREESSEVDRRGESALKQAQEAVEALFRLNAHYFDEHAVETAGKKNEAIAEKMQQTLTLLDSLQDSLPKEKLLYLRGKSFNVLPDHSPDAEALLSKAVKQDPSMTDAWNMLGETYWKKGNIQQAHDCFLSSLLHVKTKEGLRNLSMVLRQMGTSPAEREARVRESVETAKEAVGLDVRDGISWMILGNAYLSLYFTVSQDQKLLKQSMSAYSQAEKDSVAACSPDLHYNRATLCLYEEDYARTLHELHAAASLDPGWSLPRDEIANARHFLQSMTQSLLSKGRMKSKKSFSLMSALSSPDQYLGTYSEGREHVLFASLHEGGNQGRVFMGGVTSIVSSERKVPYACTLTDASGSMVGLTVYNIASSTHFNIGDIITLPDPHLRHISLDDEVNFWSIRCTRPHCMLLNGKKLPVEKLAPSVLSITTFN